MTDEIMTEKVNLKLKNVRSIYSKNGIVYDLKIITATLTNVPVTMR